MIKPQISYSSTVSKPLPERSKTVKNKINKRETTTQIFTTLVYVDENLEENLNWKKVLK